MRRFFGFIHHFQETFAQEASFFQRMGHIMRKIFVCLTMLLISTCVVVADTIYLRDGSIIKGTFIGFENGSFIIETSRGDRDSYQARYVSRVVMDRPEIDSDSRSTRYPRRDFNRSLILTRIIFPR